MIGLFATLDAMFVWSNRAEGILWAAMGAAVWLWGRKRELPQRRLAARALAVLVIFGVSDWVEATSVSGAWWRPWWLFAWKAGCVLALGWLFVRLRGHGTPPAA